MSLYDCYRNMHTRCYNPEYHSFHRYGGRGIVVDPRWHSWPTFREDMQEGYRLGMSVERKDTDGPYSPENCRWLPIAENVKTLKYNPIDILDLYKSGMSQKELAALLGTDQPYVSRLLKKARNG